MGAPELKVQLSTEMEAHAAKAQLEDEQVRALYWEGLAYHAFDGLAHTLLGGFGD